jgi:hypothetical protein
VRERGYENDEPELTSVVIRLEGVDSADEHDELLRALFEELQDADLERVEFERALDIPAGAKAGDGTNIAIAVSLISAGVEPLILLAHGWLRRRKAPCVLHIQGPNGVTLELPNVPMEQAQAMMERWAAANVSPTGDT